MKAVWLGTVLSTLLILTTLTACGTPASTTGAHRQAGTVSGPVPDLVTIVESNPLHQEASQINKTITNTTTVARLYHDLTGLPAVTTTGPRSCPADFGVTYKLTFQKDGTTVDTVSVDPSGCRMIRFNNLPKDGESNEGAEFFTDLSLAISVPEIQLTGVPTQPFVVQLQPNPTEIVITKNQKTVSIKSKAAIASLVQLFNTALRTKSEGVSCMAMTTDVYRIAFVYQDHEKRVFENSGGACQPFIDMYTGLKFPSISVLSNKYLQ